MGSCFTAATIPTPEDVHGPQSSQIVQDYLDITNEHCKNIANEQNDGNNVYPKTIAQIHLNEPAVGLHLETTVIHSEYNMEILPSPTNSITLSIRDIMKDRAHQRLSDIRDIKFIPTLSRNVSFSHTPKPHKSEDDTMDAVSVLSSVSLHSSEALYEVVLQDDINETDGNTLMNTNYRCNKTNSNVEGIVVHKEGIEIIGETINDEIELNT